MEANLKLAASWIACLAGVSGAGLSRADAVDDSFGRLEDLKGEWVANLPGFGTVTNKIRVISNDTAIEETIGTPADNETSVYSRDGGQVLLHHFCAMTAKGHVVRLIGRRLKNDRDTIEFDFQSASNLRDPSEPHMRRVLITFVDADHFRERWTKTEHGSDTLFDLNFSRK
jgi:hypothetical protein